MKVNRGRGPHADTEASTRFFKMWKSTAHVIFIWQPQSPQKSCPHPLRCQRFDFGPHLVEVQRAERGGRQGGDRSIGETLAVIARAAREACDAIGTLDQLASYCEAHLPPGTRGAAGRAEQDCSLSGRHRGGGQYQGSLLFVERLAQTARTSTVHAGHAGPPARLT